MHAITRHLWQLILTIGGIIAQIRSHLGPHFQNCFVILFKSTYVFATGSTKGMATPRQHTGVAILDIPEIKALLSTEAPLQPFIPETKQ